jgi:hypothetical protein
VRHTDRLQPDDPFHVNEVFVSVWNCMGLYPLLYAAMLIPAARGGGKVRAPPGCKWWAV